jgi:hypothetical protein
MMITLSEKRSGFLLGKSVLASAVIRIRAGRNLGEGYAPAAGVPAPSAGAAPTTELGPSCRSQDRSIDESASQRTRPGAAGCDRQVRHGVAQLGGSWYRDGSAWTLNHIGDQVRLSITGPCDRLRPPRTW